MNNSDGRGSGWFEHERKFLVEDLGILAGSTGYLVEQGYLWQGDGYEIRVRTAVSDAPSAAGEEHRVALLTLKGPPDDRTRMERELDIPFEHAMRLLEMAPNRLRKTRYEPVISSGEVWAVDVFHDDNEGLVLAELEGSLKAVGDAGQPWWCGSEVTNDPRYSNAALAAAPWTTWN
ncbi:hypothetical protein ASE12_11890 [Aeromicrobium sp. Root236]|uniref:CYTH domain-containing protein n=1 Tax=Aeromicrobium sp. Root236 TaxID=1736498 RepID=UPI0006F29133|nr:hypothetical protein [Aeromicrobium sp. Root236]KRC65392.1 hypothetical protein ASE12_11890 [Aeromicrobium sp. Root236]